jgi:DNA-3-methyladenine glycosylase II
VLDSGPAKLSVTQEENQEPRLIVTIHSKTGVGERIEREVELLVRKMLGTATDLQAFYTLANDSDSLGPLVDQFSGVKPPRFASVFEGLVNSIACQQVTLDLGIALLNRLSDKFGMGFVDHGMVLHAFPAPTDLAVASVEEVRELGFSRQKARAIKELSASVADNIINLASIEDMSNQEAVAFLTTIRGIGRWSAEYVLLRGLGRLDTFPGDDIGAQNNLQRLFRLANKPNYEEIRQLTSQWHPYEGVVYFHLLLEKLHSTGVISDLPTGPTG